MRPRRKSRQHNTLTVAPRLSTLVPKAKKAPAFSESEDAVAKILRDKANSLSSQIVSLIPNLEGALAVTIAVLGAAGTFGITQNHPVIIIGLPFPLILLYTVLLQKNTELLSRAGHKRFLEEEYERRTATRLLLEELYVAPTLHGRFRVGRLSLLMMNCFQAALLLLTFSLATRAALGEPKKIFVAFLLGASFGLVMLISAFLEHQSAYKRAYDAAANAVRSGRQSGTSMLGRPKQT